jgi:chemotaxis protein methyltransferase CheR
MEDISVNDVSKVIEALKFSTGSDFGNYAFSSFRRRIVRFTEIKRIREIGVLVESIRRDRNYAENFIEELTVNVTEMFRDPSFWALIRDTVLPVIAKRQSIRIWHAACSTGEEVYSMAILLQEADLLHKSRIVATDINKNVLRHASEGAFKLKSQEVNSKNYNLMQGKCTLSDYYVQTENIVKFNPELIRNVEFMQHDLTRDKSFSVFDLVLCRNVLIYFNSELQESVLSTINKSMETGSFLAIGSKESIRWCREAYCFHEESIEEKIYRKVAERKFSH